MCVFTPGKSVSPDQYYVFTFSFGASHVTLYFFASGLEFVDQMCGRSFNDWTEIFAAGEAKKATVKVALNSHGI